MEIKGPQSLARRLLLTLILVAVAALLRWWPLQHMGTRLAYLTFFPAVTLASVYGGRIPGILATILSSIFVYIWQITSNPDFTNLVGLEGFVIFFMTGLLIADTSEELISERVRTDSALELAEIERKRADEARLAQQQIAESEARYRVITDNAADAVLIANPEGRFIYANSQAEKILGYSARELLDMGIADITPPEDVESEMRAFNRLKNTGRGLWEVKQLCRDGSIISSELNALLLPDGNYYGSFRNITDRKQTEQKIVEYVKQLDDYLQQLQESMQGTLQAVSNMVEQRDPYTAGHERRVGIIAADIAREMGWPKDKCKELELIGLVHDIGKIGIPAEILSKPGRLTDIEYDLVKSHVERGYEILKDVKFPLPIAEIIRQHHERMDGSGYPRGLKGDQILPEARILAVADVVESMSSHRPYRPALGVKAALDEIISARGKLYDAAVVDAFIALVNEKGYQLPE